MNDAKGRFDKWSEIHLQYHDFLDEGFEATDSGYGNTSYDPSITEYYHTGWYELSFTLEKPIQKFTKILWEYFPLDESYKKDNTAGSVDWSHDENTIVVGISYFSFSSFYTHNDEENEFQIFYNVAKNEDLGVIADMPDHIVWDKDSTEGDIYFVKNDIVELKTFLNVFNSTLEFGNIDSGKIEEWVEEEYSEIVQLTNSKDILENFGYWEEENY
jgi:hypothetical protein